MARGGKRDGAGRKSGTPNKASAERQKAIAASGLTPLDYMLNVLRDDDETAERRAWAASAAAPYVHPKLASVEHKGNAEKPIVHELRRTIVDPRHSDRKGIPPAS